MDKEVLDDEWNDPTLQYRIVFGSARFSSREEVIKKYDKLGKEIL